MIEWSKYINQERVKEISWKDLIVEFTALDALVTGAQSLDESLEGMPALLKIMINACSSSGQVVDDCVSQIQVFREAKQKLIECIAFKAYTEHKDDIKSWTLKENT